MDKIEDYKSLVYNVFCQGESGYAEFWDIDRLAHFISIDGIRIKEFNAKSLADYNKRYEFAKKGGVQVYEKELLTSILKKLRYKIVGYELWVNGGKADVVAKKGKLTVACECLCCRISKAWEYLEKKNTELWVFINPKQIFIIRRGSNWEKIHKILNPYLYPNEKIDSGKFNCGRWISPTEELKKTD